MAGSADQSRARVFSVSLGGRSGGGATYAPSGYARQYLDDMAKLQFDEAQSKMRREEERAAAEEARLARQERLDAFRLEQEQRIQKHQEFMESIELEKQMLAMKNAEREQAQELQAYKTLDMIADLPVHSPNFQSALKQLRSNQYAAQVLTGKYRAAVDNAIKEKTKEFTDYIKPIMDDAKNVGFTGGIESLPVNKDGEFDREKIYGSNGIFEQSFNQMSSRMAERGLFPQTDESGKVVFKARKPEVTKEELIQAAMEIDPKGETMGVAGFSTSTGKILPVIKGGGDMEKVVPLSQAYPQKFSDEAMAGVKSLGAAGGTAFIPSAPVEQQAATTQQPTAESAPKPTMTMQDFLRSRQEAQQPPAEATTQPESVDDQAQ